MTNIKDLLNNIHDKEVTIYDKATKYTTIIFCGNASEAIKKYGTWIWTGYDMQENGIDIFVYTT